MLHKPKHVLSSRQGLTPLCMVITLFSLLCLPLLLSADEPFAPWVELTPDGKSMAQQKKVPTKAEVGIPAYPKGFIADIASMEDKQSGQMIPVIHMVSPDDVETVRAFYQTELQKIPGWKWDEIFEAFYVGDSYEEALAQLKPYMEITAVTADSDRLKQVEPSVKSTLKSWIQIVCSPKK